jgi:hypothetical protein
MLEKIWQFWLKTHSRDIMRNSKLY